MHRQVDDARGSRREEAERRIADCAARGLVKLDLFELGLTVLPERLWDLAGLTTLGLSGNRLTALPERLGDLGGLTTLDLSDNKLTALPERIGELGDKTNIICNSSGSRAGLREAEGFSENCGVA
ncbi:MAG: hypothetical protein EXQ87_13070 [Alphaproteobacteria bacterium]|nr:hypothetical protein [Alphaproteobacteria bacterium]